MTGQGPAGELTFTDLRKRLASLSDRLGQMDADRDAHAAEAVTTQSVPSVTHKDTGGG